MHGRAADAGATSAGPRKIDLAQHPKASFHEGLAAVRIDGRYGYVDSAGRVVIEPRFDYANIFSDGLARVVVDGRSGYIDATGAIVIEPHFHKAFKFSEGLARVCAPPENPSFLFRLGRFFGYEDHYAYPCGYIDRSGTLVIDYLYVPASGFENGRAEVTTLDGRRGSVKRKGAFSPAPPESSAPADDATR